MKKINKIIINYIPDYDAQTDHYGKFSDEPGKFAVKHSDNAGQWKYFNAENVENMKQAKENYKRIMDIENGNIQIYGIKAEAEIATSLENVYPAGNWLINHLSSGGLWGLESDANEADFKEVEAEQLDELKDVLLALGFTMAEYTAAPVEVKKN
jgi:hypothetical protein